jgi:hypothetical protein
MTPDQKRSLNVVMMALYVNEATKYTKFVLETEKELHPSYRNAFRNFLTVAERNRKLIESLVPAEDTDHYSSFLDDLQREFVERNITIEP